MSLTPHCFNSKQCSPIYSLEKHGLIPSMYQVLDLENEVENLIPNKPLSIEFVLPKFSKTKGRKESLSYCSTSGDYRALQCQPTAARDLVPRQLVSSFGVWQSLSLVSWAKPTWIKRWQSQLSIGVGSGRYSKILGFFYHSG